MDRPVDRDGARKGGSGAPQPLHRGFADAVGRARRELDEPLAGYHAYHATRADLLRRLGRGQESRAAYDRAIALAGNTAETAYLTRRRDQLGSSRPG